MARLPYRHPAYRFLRDYQTLAFNPFLVTALSAGTANLTLSTRFIVTKLSAVAYRQNLTTLVTQQEDFPAVLTTFRIHSTPMDAAPAPLRNVWGTGKKPTVLDVPIALEWGTSLSIDCDTRFGQVTGINAGQLNIFFTLHGYIPTSEEYRIIKDYNERNFTREWATNTLSSVTAYDYTAKAPVTLQADFPNDLMVTSAAGSAFVPSPATDSFAQNYADPVNLVQMFTKTALLNSPADGFRSVLGTAEFPTPVQPSLLIKAQDRLLATISDAGTGGAITLPAGSTARHYITFRGYVPNEPVVRAAAVQRGDSAATNARGPAIVLPHG